MPEPPPWVWLAVAIAIPLLAVGLTPTSSPESRNPGSKRQKTGLFSYLGGLLLVVALSVSTNYIGSDQNFDEVGFITAVVAVGLLTLLAVLLAGIAAFVMAGSGARLIVSGGYWRSVTVLIVTCLTGLCIGGLAGLSLVGLPS